MSKRNEIVILAVLLAVLLGVAYQQFRPSGGSDTDVSAAAAVQPLRVPNPSLHLAQLAQIRRLAYGGSHRNIFSAAPPPPTSVLEKSKRKDASYLPQTAGPPSPPPLQVPLTFYGMAVDPKSGKRLAFFTSGDDVFIASEGDSLLGRFRLVRVGTDTVVVEEISTGRQTTLTMTPPVPSADEPPGVR
ncbi:MAG TPA: hypothetical protein VGS20_03715 [Candidatus Acidoferrales bacterium]|nr:hypothetical protein [Candidatus Acidoferrales bacterium]